MNKEKAIEQANLSITKMKSGAGAFRDQVNNHLLPELENEGNLIDAVMKIKKGYNASMRETRVLLTELKEKIKNPGPIIPPLPRNEYLDFDALGIFLDILEHGYDSPAQEEETFQRIEEVIAMAARYCKRVSFFSNLGDGQSDHINLEGKMPWVVNKKGKIEFDNPNAHYRHLYRRFLTLLNKYYMEAIPQSQMWKYTTDFYWLPENNTNGIKSFFDTNALEYQQWLAYMLVSDQADLEMNPNIKPMNEPNHLHFAKYGFENKFELGHFFADWHKEVWGIVRKLMKMTDFVIDVHASEYALAQLVEHGKAERVCEHCGIAWDNTPGHNRKIKREQHSVSIPDDLHRGYVDHTAFVKNTKNWQIKYSEDGSKFGKIKPIPTEHWRCGDPEEVKEMLLTGWGMCKEWSEKTGLPNDMYWGLHPKTCLKFIDGVFHDYYDANEMKIEWERLEASGEAHKQMHG